jgi:uncharacterized membrane protein YccC
MSTPENAEPGTPPTISVREHWRAGPSVRRAKGIGGLAGFFLAVAAGVVNGASGSDILWHGLLAGLAGWMVAWGAALVVWRQLVPAETRYLAYEVIETRRRLLEEQRARLQAEEAARAERARAGAAD